ncbi:MAG TPA: hypothetical protein VGV38_07630 [Pyrinomonadaceae bacterium]|nr:hypothetical protein [Pyrinomonadaceae bacterium]
MTTDKQGNPRLGAFVIALVVCALAALAVFAVYKLTVQSETRRARPAPVQGTP